MYSVEDIMREFKFPEEIARDVYNKTPKHIIELCSKALNSQDIEEVHSIKHQLRGIVPLYGDPEIQEILDNVWRGQTMLEMKLALAKIVSLVGERACINK